MNNDVSDEELVVISMAGGKMPANTLLVASASDDGILVEIIDTEDGIEEIDGSKDLSISQGIGAEVKNIRAEKPEKRNAQYHHIHNKHPKRVGGKNI